jgi:hypothetical protein
MDQGSMTMRQAQTHRTGAVACARVVDIPNLTTLSLSVLPGLILTVLIIVVLLLTGGSGGG